ncbi:hypothetical protein FGSG_05474 [Fusarium graminearum PH-1]|uniref:hypothetical protein n=1 Tax=Gibberella zeae (strain ATCC MYA-4620 / CBS 123657 / FGSC 9075 / NRRL 31084 / PH-1) TaxID=229533 RepID=UPI000023F569|nr:hypothetical protein FGSG_05474 [Fusarium graminearum PH-1]ESU11438.1 hypothetical protein FGSG_05474 [Fusarium graminearum PH-1]EYB26152.1 hypothetical protein FG05_05474 [Fusarium graminearum]|eukprot:XP_011324014.1 hypothetical protein FGSG_05474 [Fusarium graminearum PH-1]
MARTLADTTRSRNWSDGNPWAWDSALEEEPWAIEEAVDGERAGNSGSGGGVQNLIAEDSIPSWHHLRHMPPIKAVAVFDTRSSEMLIIGRGFRIERNASLPRRGDGGEILSPSIALDSDQCMYLPIWLCFARVLAFFSEK